MAPFHRRLPCLLPLNLTTLVFLALIITGFHPDGVTAVYPPRLQPPPNENNNKPLPFFRGLAPPPLRYADWVKSELYFGLSIQNAQGRTIGNVSDAQFDAFVAEYVAPRFPAGWTVLSAAGAWASQTANGSVVHERSKVLLVYHPAKGNWAARVAAVVEAYRTLFYQEAVLYSSINAHVCITNDTCLSTAFYAEGLGKGRGRRDGEGSMQRASAGPHADAASSRKHGGAFKGAGATTGHAAAAATPVCTGSVDGNHSAESCCPPLFSVGSRLCAAWMPTGPWLIVLLLLVAWLPAMVLLHVVRQQARALLLLETRLRGGEGRAASSTACLTLK